MTKLFYISLISALFFVPSLSLAAEIRVITDYDTVGLGGQFEASIELNAVKSVNAVEGRVVFPSEQLRLKEIRSGNSAITFWIEEPTVGTQGDISFSGVTPGGFSGNSMFLFSAVFETLRPGPATIEARGATVLLNDGLGTKDAVNVVPAAVVVSSEVGDTTLAEVIDTEAPESFTPLISRDDALFEGRYFVVFATQDKNSGMHHFEVKEQRFPFGYFAKWENAVSPHVLADQERRSTVLVKAVDRAGNERIERIAPEDTSLSLITLILIAILAIGGVLAGALFKKVW